MASSKTNTLVWQVPALLRQLTQALCLLLLFIVSSCGGQVAGVSETEHVEGQLKVLVVRYLDGRPSDTLYELETDAPKRIRLDVDRKLDIPGESRVRAEGAFVDPDRFHASSVTATGTGKSNSAALTTLAAGTTPVTKKLLVIMAKFQDATAVPFTPDTVRNMVFGTTGSADAYYRENSFGLLRLAGVRNTTGDVTDWFPIAQNSTTCDSFAWAEAAKAAATQAGWDLNAYDNVMMYFTAAACGWGGLGELPGKYTWIVANCDQRYIVHELGHNFGLYHANVYYCYDAQGAPTPIGTNCTSLEYDDPFDTMGHPNTYHLQAYSKGKLGWLGASNTVTATSSGTFDIAPIEQTSTAIQSLRIPRDATSYYYIEYRQPFGFDNFAASNPAVNGVIIRLAPDYSVTGYTNLIDTVPSTSDADSPLLVGKTFTDSSIGLTVTLLSRTASSAKVKIDIVGPCTPSCGARTCGTDGCGGSCGNCATGTSCDAAGQCVPSGTCKLDKLVPVSAVASSTENGGTPASAAIDGSLTTRWASAFSDPQWIYVDLGASRKIRSVVLRWETAASKNYDVQVSSDAVSWTTVFTESAGTGGVKEITSLNAAGRYVRMYSRQRTTGYGNSLWEFEVYGDPDPSCGTCTPSCTGKQCGDDGCGGVCGTCSSGNTCNAGQCISTTCKLDKLVPASASASSIENAGTPASAAIDGDLSTRWASEFSDPQWLSVDLGGVRKIRRVVLRWEAAAAKNYDIQVSEDAGTWTTVFADTAGTAGTKDVTNINISARYVRMYSRSRITGWGNSLYELEVYGDTNPTCTLGCTPACTGKQCGDDGCGGTCGTCSGSTSCNASGQCVSVCQLNKLALSTATASSTQNAGTPASDAIDGNMNTRWSSAFSDPQWIFVDLGSSRFVGRVVLRWETAASKNYDVQVSSNATDWTNVFTDIAGTGGVKDITGLQSVGRYVRMYSRQRTTGYGNSLWEFEVYGDTNPACKP